MREALQRRIRGGAGAFATSHLRVCRPAAARHHLGREGRHGHQQRAPHQPRAPCRAGAAARRGTTGHRHRLRAAPRTRLRPGRPSLFAYDERGIGVERAPREHTRARSRHHRPELRRARSGGPGSSARRRAERPRARLYEDGVFPRRRPRPLRRPPTCRWPSRARRAALQLTTGRLRDQWHGMSRTGTVGRLFGHVAEPAVRCTRRTWNAPALAEGRPGCTSPRRRGSIVLPAAVEHRPDPAQAFIAMHWGDVNTSAGAAPTARRRLASTRHQSGLLPRVAPARAQARRGEDPQAELPGGCSPWLAARGRALRADASSCAS